MNKGVQRWPLSRVWLHLWRSLNPFFRPVWKQCFFSLFLVVSWCCGSSNDVTFTLFCSILVWHHHQVEVFIQTLKILTSVSERKNFCRFVRTDNLLTTFDLQCQSSISTWFPLLKKLVDVWAADVKSTVAFKELHLTDGCTDCSPWFRPLKSLQSSTTITVFRR